MNPITSSSFFKHRKKSGEDFYLYKRQGTLSVFRKFEIDSLDLLKKLYFSVLPGSYDRIIDRIKNNIASRYQRMGPSEIINYLNRIFTNDHLRKYEYSFEAEQLNKLGMDGVILDVGGGLGYSTIVPALLATDNTRIYSLDVNNKAKSGKYHIEWIQGTATKIPLKPSSVDIITCISTLEHIGLGGYGDPIDYDGDIRAINECKRVLKKGGHLILTIPYGHPTIVFDLHRIYDRDRIELITKGFVKKTARYTLNGYLAKESKVGTTKASYHIPGFYKETPLHERHPDAQGGVLLFLQKI